jgi:hypothetical protein
VRRLFDFLTLALWALWCFYGCKATRRRRCAIVVDFFSNRFKYFRLNRRYSGWRRRWSGGFLTIGLRALALLFGALCTLLGFTAAAFFQHGQTRFFSFAKQLCLTFLTAQHVIARRTRRWCSRSRRRCGRDRRSGWWRRWWWRGDFSLRRVTGLTDKLLALNLDNNFICAAMAKGLFDFTGLERAAQSERLAR